MKFKPIVVFKTIVSLGLFALVLTRVDLSQAWARFQQISLPFVIFALVYYTGCQWLSCWRWQVILRSTGYLIPMRTLLSSYFAGMFLNTFLPGSFGGDVYRVYRVAQQSKNSEVAFVSVFLERFTGIAALLAIALLGLPPAFRLVGRWDIILLLMSCTGLLTGGVLLMISPKLLIWAEPLLNKLHLRGLIARFAKVQVLLKNFAQQRQALAWSMGLSLLLQLVIVYYYYLVAQQLKIPISYWELLVFVPIVVVVTLVPLSLGGLGVREGLLAYLFSRVGLTVEQALLLSLTLAVLGWLLSLPGGMILLLDSAGIQQIKRHKKN